MTMTREDIENNVGYWQEKANLEYIRQRQEHGVNDPYMITEIDEAFDAGFDKGYQYAVQHPQWIPVNEKLPKEKGKYMFKLSNGDMYYETYYPKLKLLGNVTHWMEIQPPQGKEDKK